MKGLLKFVCGIFLAILFIATFFWGIEKTMDASELVECNQWQQQAKTYPGFYLTEWQDQQCRHQGMAINTFIQRYAAAPSPINAIVKK